MFLQMLHAVVGFLFSYFAQQPQPNVESEGDGETVLEFGTQETKVKGYCGEEELKMAHQQEISIQNLLSRESLPVLLQLATPEKGHEINVKEIVRLITEKKSCINISDAQGGDTLLHRVAENIDEKNEEQSRLLEFLIDNGAYVNAVNINLETPLHLAVKKNKYHTVNYLMMRKADANIQNNDNNTCLHLAVEMGNIETVAILHNFAEQCLDESKTNKHHFTALDLAKQVEYNDNRLEMEKICEILQTDPEHYRHAKAYEKYLKRTDEDQIWCLRPSITFINNVYDDATLFVGNFHFSDAKAVSALMPNAELKPLAGQSFPAIMSSKVEDKRIKS